MLNFKYYQNNRLPHSNFHFPSQNHLIFLVHNMGGSVRKEVGSKMTHLIANCVGGEKYRYASLLRLPIMSVDWVHNSWAMRTQIGFNALNSLVNLFGFNYESSELDFAVFSDYLGIFVAERFEYPTN